MLENFLKLKPRAINTEIFIDQSFLSGLNLRENEIDLEFIFQFLVQVFKLYFAGRFVDVNLLLLLCKSLVVEGFKVVQFSDGLALLFKFLALLLKQLLHLLFSISLLIFCTDLCVSLLALNFPKLALALLFGWILLRIMTTVHYREGPPRLGAWPCRYSDLPGTIKISYL